MAPITGRMRHRETLSVLPWTLHTRRAEWALTAKSCFGINSEPSGPTEKTGIRRIAQTSSNPYAETPALGPGVPGVGCGLPQYRLSGGLLQAMFQALNVLVQVRHDSAQLVLKPSRH